MGTLTITNPLAGQTVQGATLAVEFDWDASPSVLMGTTLVNAIVTGPGGIFRQTFTSYALSGASGHSSMVANMPVDAPSGSYTVEVTMTGNSVQLSGSQSFASSGSGGGAPWVSIDAPVAGATVGSSIDLQLSYGNITPGNYQVKVVGNGVLFAPGSLLASSGALVLVVDVRGFPANGAQILTVWLIDSGGVTTASAAVSVDYQAVSGDSTAPTVVITAPEAAANLQGSVVLAATAADETEIWRVTWLLDNTVIGYSFAPVGAKTFAAAHTLNCRRLSNGAHTIGALARDVAGNVSALATIVASVANSIADSTEYFWTPQLGTDANDVPINAASANFDGVLIRGMFVLDEEQDLPTDPAELYNLEAGYNCPGVTKDMAQAVLIDDMHRSFPLLPAGSRTVRWFLRARPRQRIITSEVATTASLIRLGLLDDGAIVALATGPYQVLRINPATLAATVLADLSDLATAPTDMAVGGGKVWVAAGDLVVVLDQDAGDQRFDLRLGADVTAVTALAWSGTALLAGVDVTGGGHRLEGWTYARFRSLATWDNQITALAMLGGDLYGGDAAGQVLKVNSLGVINVAHATAQASVTRLALQNGALVLIGTGDAGKLFGNLGGWAEVGDFAFGQVNGLAVVDGWLWAGGSGSGQLWRQGNEGWETLYTIGDLSDVHDMLAIDSQLIVAGNTATAGKLASIQLLEAGEIMVSNGWVADERNRRYMFSVLESM